ncbi:DUF2062 domain-containing protein [Sphingomonas quercus]|uniref:DUF2062 domain-containing protein n=1 Tax=Sphingomonas quercus TaxID=2842451 RepID=A0ABS6BGK3_9SPHN|nr:DUF2062 domain-containing protein [Sphingomonas quercus]MBU3077433.1 DUF2062 domain-containing protein [Sphingomonas quercus]
MSERLGRLARWFSRHMPTRESFEQSRLIGPVAHLVLRPELWRFTRRSVPRGVALGTVVGIFVMIPGLQIVGAALACIPVRGNIPIAAGMTFLSNPGTTPFILATSLGVGNWLLGSNATMAAVWALYAGHAPLSAYGRWLLSEAAPALLTGLLLISLALGLIGYGLSALLWRLWTARKWGHRSNGGRG